MKTKIAKWMMIMLSPLISCDNDETLTPEACLIPLYVFSPSQAGAHTFDVRIVASMHVAVNTNNGDVIDSFRQMKDLWKIYIKKNNDKATEFSALDVDFQPRPSAGAGWTVYTYTGSLDLQAGDNVQIYWERKADIYPAITIWTAAGARYNPLNGVSAVYDNVTTFNTPSYINVSGITAYPGLEKEGQAECTYLYGQFTY